MTPFDHPRRGHSSVSPSYLTHDTRTPEPVGVLPGTSTLRGRLDTVGPRSPGPDTVGQGPQSDGNPPPSLL